MFINMLVVVLLITFMIGGASAEGLNGDSRCAFLIGDGVGGSEIKIGNQKGSACVDACLTRKKSDATINGVTVYSDTGKGGCWCERKMSGRNSVAKYKSCFIDDAGVDGDSRCSYFIGDGTGSGEVKIGDQRGSACVDACLAKKETDATINGVTVFTDTSKGGCWCEKKMHTRDKADAKYKSCFITDEGLNGDDRCTFHTGDGTGGSEVKIGSQRGRDCIDACLIRKKSDPTINGVTVYANTDKGGCWCEKKMSHRRSTTTYKSCFIDDAGVDGDSRCSYFIGDGSGGGEIKIGYQRGSACVDACLAKKKTDATINGVTVFTDTSKGGCWCEKKMNGRDKEDAKYKSCFIGDAGLDGDSRCTFFNGNGITQSSIYVGKQRGSICIDACLQRRKADKTINGVAVFSDPSREGSCWCAKKMNGRDIDNAYKSCFLEASEDQSYIFLPGDGIGGTEVQIGSQKGQACILACLNAQKTDASINGVTTSSDSGMSGCWCEKGMNGRNDNKKRMSCFIGNAGLNGDTRGTFHTGDGIGGSEIKIGNQKGSACIDACLQAKQKDDSINGVTVFSDTSKGGCWCEKKMKSRNSNGRYKSLMFGETEVVPTQTSKEELCHQGFRKVGCYKRNWEKLTDLLITDLDPTHANYTQDMKWDEYSAGLHSLACRCREKAVGHYKYFAIGFHAECVAGKDYAALEKMFAKQSEEDVNGCINGQNEACDKNHKAECSGIVDYDFFYAIQ